MWDKRFDTDEYIYGTDPNDFLAHMATRIPSGNVLSLAEGEGRNAVFLAEQGYHVTAVDQSPVGLQKARKLADKRNVNLEIQVHDLAGYHIGTECWSGIVSIFCHLPAEERRRLHRHVVAGLRPGGVFILEAYTPAQLQFKTGGPPVVELMMTLEDLKIELNGLVFEQAAEVERDIFEGKMHTGKSAVVQIVARKP